ncbi:ninjurin-1-like isoform X2 [Harmonia axyridis]|uniref:ninjurin-1-like isoform X2 n=1 Tax=Harmonia axyridis TaxID=115357 RepID=UPI001E278B7B|nr:ninjurin-1-like isoform X2 [Harmonia axyridis]
MSRENEQTISTVSGDITTVDRVAQKAQKDGILEIIEKTLDPNKYATKKTIAQGLLDVALLTANASQLKYILQVGPKHEFYTLMLSLIIVSIILQIVQGTLCIFLGVKFDINDKDDHSPADKVNNFVVLTNFLLMGVNIVINTFDMRSSDSAT